MIQVKILITFSLLVTESIHFGQEKRCIGCQASDLRDFKVSQSHLSAFWSGLLLPPDISLWTTLKTLSPARGWQQYVLTYHRRRATQNDFISRTDSLWGKLNKPGKGVQFSVKQNCALLMLLPTALLTRIKDPHKSIVTEGRMILPLLGTRPCWQLFLDLFLMRLLIQFSHNLSTSHIINLNINFHLALLNFIMCLWQQNLTLCIDPKH
jgi:hypothetical protein